MGFEIIDV